MINRAMKLEIEVMTDDDLLKFYNLLKQHEETSIKLQFRNLYVYINELLKLVSEEIKLRKNNKY